MSLGAVAITGGAVVGAAVIAAVAAQVRLKTSLEAEQKRLESTLGAESKRLERRLEHDRELTDLLELRKLLDRAARHLRRSHDKYADMAVLVDAYLKTGSPTGDAEQEFYEEMREFSSITLKVIYDAISLAARLDKNSSIVAAHQDACNSLTNLPRPSWPPSKPDAEKIYSASNKSWGVLGRFVEACRCQVGVRLPAIAGDDANAA